MRFRRQWNGTGSSWLGLVRRLVFPGARPLPPDRRLTMARRVLVALGLLGLFCAWVVHADEPAKPEPSESKPAVTNADLALKKEIDARKFRELQQALLRLAQRLENSNKSEDRER